MIFFINTKHIKKQFIFITFLSIFLNNCALKEPIKNHGINFLSSKYKVLKVNKDNKNDVMKIIGRPHTVALDTDNTWLYFERQMTKGDYHKLGKNVLLKNNVLRLEFNKYGVLEKKELFDKDKMKKVKLSKDITKNKLTKKSNVTGFLQSIRQKMYKRD